jgi:hypothetical protein
MIEERRRADLERAQDIPTEVVWAFRDRLHRDGSHQLWQGAVDNAGTPALCHRPVTYSVLRIAWLLHHDAPPVGGLRISCGTPLCVRGAHLTDSATRQREQLALAEILGIDMSGTCRAGHLRAEFGTVRGSGRVECRSCDTARRREQRAAAQTEAAA